MVGGFVDFSLYKSVVSIIIWCDIELNWTLFGGWGNNNNKQCEILRNRLPIPLLPCLMNSHLHVSHHIQKYLGSKKCITQRLSCREKEEEVEVANVTGLLGLRKRGGGGGGDGNENCSPPAVAPQKPHIHKNWKVKQHKYWHWEWVLLRKCWLVVGLELVLV